MVLYKLILVDDEEEVRESIKRKVNWEQLGFQVIGTAGNGEEALELAEQEAADVVMTDIKMPFMDGLTLARKLKENYKNTKIVVYSGFDDFEFAREAIHLEVEEYLLKPISSADLAEVFTRIKEILDKEIDERTNTKKLYDYYQKSLPMMQEQVFISLLSGRMYTDKAIALLKSYDIELKASNYGVSVLKADFEELNISPMEEQMWYLSILDIVNNYFKELITIKSFVFLDKVIVIALLEEKKTIHELLYHMNQICKMAGRVLGIPVSAGVGRPYHHVGKLSISYEEASSALEYRAVVGAVGQAVSIQDVEPNQSGSTTLEHFDIEGILHAIKLGSEEELEKEIKNFVEILKKGKIGIRQYQFIFTELVTEILKIGRTYEIDADTIFGENFDPYLEIKKFNSLDELGEWIFKVGLNIRHSIKKERIDSTRMLVQNAKKYMEEHYSDSNLSVETLCVHLGVSAPYFSTIFKKEAGMTFVAYLTKIRLEHAVELLNHTNEKSYFIAEQVGYTEPNYFSYVFKKQYGVSPTKYRAAKGKQIHES